MREIEQLHAVAHHYLAQASEIIKANARLGSKTIGEVARLHRRRTLSPGELALAHFGSAAVRLATLCELGACRGTEDYRQKFYERSGHRKSKRSAGSTRTAMRSEVEQHIHLLLRDNIAHREPGSANKRHMASDRSAVLKKTTLATCEHGLRTLAKRVES